MRILYISYRYSNISSTFRRSLCTRRANFICYTAMPDIIGFFNELRTIRALESSNQTIETRFETLDLLYLSKDRTKSEAFYICEYDFEDKLKKINKIKEQNGSRIDLLSKTQNIISCLLSSKNKKFVFSHNHPTENSSPTGDDIFFTFGYNRFLKEKKKILVDHIIWSRRDIYSFKNQSRLLN